MTAQGFCGAGIQARHRGDGPSAHEDKGLSPGELKGRGGSKTWDLSHLEVLSATHTAPGLGWLDGSAVSQRACNAASREAGRLGSGISTRNIPREPSCVAFKDRPSEVTASLPPYVWVGAVPSQPRFEGREHRPHISPWRCKNLGPVSRTAMPSSPLN